jgi:hypothetical protein
MKTIEAYQSADGLIHTDEDKARAHDDDLIGQELDELLHRIMCIDPGHRAMCNGVLSALKKKKELLTCLRRMVAVIEYDEPAK